MGPTQDVVLLDEEWISTLYVAVGLRNAGCTVHIVTACPSDPDVKYLGRGITREVVPPVDCPGYLQAVERALASRQSSIVLALTEAVLYRLWDEEPAWLDRVYPRSNALQRQLLRDKARLSAYVDSAGVRVPMQRHVASEADVDAAIEALGLPLVVKGVRGSGGSRVRVAHSALQARNAFSSITKHCDCFLEQHIPGPTFLVGGLFHEGNPIRIYSAEKVDCFPRETGPSVRLRSGADEAVLGAALASFRALGWSGLASADIIRQPDGTCYFIEINPRPWGSIAAAAGAGVDLFSPLTQILAGDLPLPDLSFGHGVKSALFPQTAIARLRGGGVRSLKCLVREPQVWLGAPWRNPGLTAHLARQIWWRWREGTRVRRASRRSEIAREEQGV